jgi:hypothetical protein
VFTSNDILWSIVVPLVVSAVIAIVGCQPWRAFGAPRLLWIGPVAMGVAFIIAFPGVNSGVWKWPLGVPRESSEWLACIALLATITGVLSATLWTPRWILAILVFLFSAIACGLFLKFKFTSHTWSFAGGASMLAAFALVAVLWWIALEQATEEWPILGALFVGISSACVALALMLTGSLSSGKFATIVGFATAGFLPAILWRRSIRLTGMSAFFSVILLPLLLGGYYLSKLPTNVLLILVSTPLFIALGILLPTRMRFWQRIVLRVVIGAIPLVTAVVIARTQFQQQTGEQSDDSAYYP